MLALAGGLGRGLNPLAHTGALVHGGDEAKEAALDVRAVVLAHDGTDGVGGLVSVVEGNAGNVVVEDVRLDDAVEKVAADETALAINSGGGASDKVPLLSVVVRQGRVGVLEEGNGHWREVSRNSSLCVQLVSRELTKPVVDPEVGNKVPDGQVRPAKLVAEEVEGRAGEKQAEVRESNELGVLGLVERAAGVKVVDTAAETVLLALAAALALLLVVVVASDIVDEVAGPADELLADEHGQGKGGSVLGELRQLVDQLAEAGGLLLAGAGDKDHVALYVASGLVVLAVGDLPGEVGNEQRRVEDPAGDVVDETRVGKGAVSAFMGNDPEAGAEETLEEGVDSPEGTADVDIGNMLGGVEIVEDGKGGGEVDDVAEDIQVALEGGALEAVLRDGVANVLDGVVGRGELVAVGIDELAVGGGLGLHVHLGERGERGGRGRRARRVSRRDGGRGLGRGFCDDVAAGWLGAAGNGSRDSHGEDGF